MDFELGITHRQWPLKLGALGAVAVVIGFLAPSLVPAQPATGANSGESGPPGKRTTCPPGPVKQRYQSGCDPSREGPANPVRTLAEVCPPGSIRNNACDGRLGIPTGSGGAQVRSFHTLAFSKSTNRFKVEWACPDWSGDVLVQCRIGAYSRRFYRPCGAQREEWAPDGFRSTGIGHADVSVLVELLTGTSPCRIPIHLLAHFTVPFDLFRSDDGVCARTNDARACLKIESDFAEGAWEVWLRQGQERSALDPRAGRRPNLGRMGLRQYLIDRPRSCEPFLVSVDFARKGTSEPTWIDEVRF